MAPDEDLALTSPLTLKAGHETVSYWMASANARYDEAQDLTGGAE
jgi:hypothetical protein